MSQHTRTDLEHVTKKIRRRIRKYRDRLPVSIDLDDLHQATLLAYISGVDRLKIHHLPVEDRLRILNTRMNGAMIDELRIAGHIGRRDSGGVRSGYYSQMSLDGTASNPANENSFSDWLIDDAGHSTPSAEDQAIEKLLDDLTTKIIETYPPRTQEIWRLRQAGIITKVTHRPEQTKQGHKTVVIDWTSNAPHQTHQPTHPRNQQQPSMTNSYYGTGNTISRKERLYIIRRDRNTCRKCHNNFATKDLDVDHIVPVAEGGTDSRGNLCALCKPCHDNKTLAEIERGRQRASIYRPDGYQHPTQTTNQPNPRS